METIMMVTNELDSVINGDDDDKVTVMVMAVAIVQVTGKLKMAICHKHYSDSWARYYVLVLSRNCYHSSVG